MQTAPGRQPASWRGAEGQWEPGRKCYHFDRSAHSDFRPHHDRHTRRTTFQRQHCSYRQCRGVCGHRHSLESCCALRLRFFLSRDLRRSLYCSMVAYGWDNKFSGRQYLYVHIDLKCLVEFKFRFWNTKKTNNRCVNFLYTSKYEYSPC